jgi:hypothetical protein
LVSQGEGLRHTMESSEVQEVAREALPVRLIRTWVPIQTCLRRQKRS